MMDGPREGANLSKKTVMQAHTRNVAGGTEN